MKAHADRTIFASPQDAWSAFPKDGNQYHLVETLDGGIAVQAYEAGWNGRFLGYL